MANAKPHLDSMYCNTYLVIFHEDPITWCLVSQNYDNENVYSLYLPCKQIMCRIFNYRSKRVIYFWPISVNFHWAISAPIISQHSRWIISKRELHSSCAEIQPFEQRRGIMSARPAAGRNSRESLCFRGLLSRRTPLPTLSVCPTFLLNYSLEFGSFLTDFIFLQATKFTFPCVFGKFIYRQTFDCLCERYLTMIPCMPV